MVSPLHVVWGGANDIFAALGQPPALPELDAAALSLKGILADLIAHGASHLLVPNIPDVGITPAVRAHGREALRRPASSPTISTELSSRVLLILQALQAAFGFTASRNGRGKTLEASDSPTSAIRAAGLINATNSYFGTKFIPPGQPMRVWQRQHLTQYLLSSDRCSIAHPKRRN